MLQPGARGGGGTERNADCQRGAYRHQHQQQVLTRQSTEVVGEQAVDKTGAPLWRAAVLRLDEIGGVNVLVDPAMNDTVSGATFQKGWFAMNGQAALAYSRNRKGVANGDFTRSYNQGSLLLYSLAKLREEVSDAPGLVRWIRILQANADTNLKPTDMLTLAQIARSIDPSNMTNVVLAGKNVKLGSGKKAQDAIRLNPGYVGFFTDVARDAVNDGR